MTDERSEDSDPAPAIRRRDVMKAVGGTAVGISGLAGVASAGGKHKKKGKRKKRDGKTKWYNFYGCSQVCVAKRGVKAVVWNGHKFRYKRIRRRSNRNDPPVRDWKKVYCYEVKDGNAIVGICYRGKFFKNRNRCVKNYPKPKYCGQRYPY